ncbi:hypothetical protein QE152_g19714 [Popillia japonica]|uniref:Uncharacterized protein n=1 Tax=Popillia japonica TaxID=7064 RepID=A0AAW1KQ56_POPJA
MKSTASSEYSTSVYQARYILRRSGNGRDEIYFTAKRKRKGDKMQQTGWIYIVVVAVEPKQPHCTMLKDEAAAQPRYTRDGYI